MTDSINEKTKITLRMWAVPAILLTLWLFVWNVAAYAFWIEGRLNLVEQKQDAIEKQVWEIKSNTDWIKNYLVTNK